MLRVRSGLAVLAVAGIFGFALVAGCSADGSGAVVDETPTDPGEAQLPPPSGTSPSDEGGKPPVKDSGTKDSSVDAGPPPPVPGTACTTVDEVRKKKCGACGDQSTICLAGAGDAGGATWSGYSPCENELAGGCVPGTIVDEACGNCGTVKKTCTQYCAFSSSACTGQPPSSCVPGNVDMSNAGCTVADTYRLRSCQNNCTYNSFTTTCSTAPTTVEVGPTVDSITWTIANLTSTNPIGRLSGTCPTSTSISTLASGITPAVYTQVHNPLPKAATVAIYNSVAPGGVVVKTYIAAYDGATIPVTDVERKACIKGTGTYGTVALTGDTKFGSLDGTLRQVTIPPDGTVTVYTGAYYAYDATKPAESTGKVKVNVKTISIAP